MVKPGPITKPDGQKVLDIHPLRVRNDEEQGRIRALTFSKYRRRWDLLPVAIMLIQDLAKCDESTAFELWKMFVVQGQVHVRWPEEIAIAADELESAMASGDGVVLPSRGAFLPWVKTDMDELRTALAPNSTVTKEPAPAVPGKRARPAMAAAAQSIAEQWPNGIPKGLRATQRDNMIIEWCRAHGTPTSLQSIRRALAELRQR